MISPERIAKLKWQCRRGMLELDLILNQFMETGIEQLTDNQIAALEQLLNESDPMLYYWLMGNEAPEDKDVAAIVNVIKLQSRSA